MDYNPIYSRKKSPISIEEVFFAKIKHKNNFDEKVVN